MSYDGGKHAKCLVIGFDLNIKEYQKCNNHIFPSQFKSSHQFELLRRDLQIEKKFLLIIRTVKKTK